MNHKGAVSDISGKKGPLSVVEIIEIYKAQLTVSISLINNFHHRFLVNYIFAKALLC